MSDHKARGDYLFNLRAQMSDRFPAGIKFAQPFKNNSRGIKVSQRVSVRQRQLCSPA